MTTQITQNPLGRRLLWFVALWAAGVGATAAVAFVLRVWIART